MAALQATAGLDSAEPKPEPETEPEPEALAVPHTVEVSVRIQSLEALFSDLTQLRDAAMLAEANLVGVDDSVMGGIQRSTGCKRGAEDDISSDDEEDEESVRKARQRTERQLQQFPGEGGVGNQQV